MTYHHLKAALTQAEAPHNALLLSALQREVVRERTHQNARDLPRHVLNFHTGCPRSLSRGASGFSLCSRRPHGILDCKDFDSPDLP